MPKAAELKRGNLIELNGHYLLVQQIDVKSPTARGAQTLYRMRFSKLPGGGKYEETFSGDDLLKEAQLERRKCSYLYREAIGIPSWMRKTTASTPSMAAPSKRSCPT